MSGGARSDVKPAPQPPTSTRRDGEELHGVAPAEASVRLLSVWVPDWSELRANPGVCAEQRCQRNTFPAQCDVRVPELKSQHQRSSCSHIGSFHAHIQTDFALDRDVCVYTSLLTVKVTRRKVDERLSCTKCRSCQALS